MTILNIQTLFKKREKAIILPVSICIIFPIKLYQNDRIISLRWRWRLAFNRLDALLVSKVSQSCSSTTMKKNSLLNAFFRNEQITSARERGWKGEWDERKREKSDFESRMHTEQTKSHLHNTFTVVVKPQARICWQNKRTREVKE